MNWFLLAIISTLSVAISNLLRRVLLKNYRGDIFSYSIVIQFAGAILVGSFAFSRGFIMPPIQNLPLNFILMAISYAAGTILVLKAMQNAEASEAAILGASSTLWVIIVSLIFLGESFNLSKITGIALILISVLLVSIKNGLKFNKNSLYILISAFCYGTAFANDAFILRQSDALSYLSIVFLFPGLAMLIVKPKAILGIKTLLKPLSLLKITTLSFFFAFSGVMTYLAYQNGGTASQLASIGQASVILTVLLAAIFIGEKDNLWKKLIAGVVTTIGVLLIK